MNLKIERGIWEKLHLPGGEDEDGGKEEASKEGEEAHIS